jgi:aerobic-type carbon monoxide dehydrogenase small subunit (CoxS/CutS family)
MEEVIRFELNGKNEEVQLDPNLTLLWVLRNQFGLTGTKYGCGMGYCSACTVIVDNLPVQSCSQSIGDVKGKKVVTIEGLSHNGEIHPLQKAFMKHDAFQCGYCTPGMIMNAYGLLLKNPSPDRTEIIRSMDNNLCRCGAHTRIIDAIETASGEMKGGNWR